MSPVSTFTSDCSATKPCTQNASEDDGMETDACMSTTYPIYTSDCQYANHRYSSPKQVQVRIFQIIDYKHL